MFKTMLFASLGLVSSLTSAGKRSVLTVDSVKATV